MYKTIVINMLGRNPSDMMRAMDDALNMVASEGYRFIYSFSKDQSLFIFTKLSESEKRGPGRPRNVNREPDEEVTSMN